ncbi:membrane steroid-binding protein 1 [Cyclospora cayetanensis]|uniref:Membrane steroid-binding protein 1 n=1 Tax=Cyclospora cayetanensis TaxID=88456 RepID=A0A6P6RXL5_9EIME|nr:membrane steroid-binding protein 1 [Cyclospora cayetanensis]
MLAGAQVAFKWLLQWGPTLIAGAAIALLGNFLLKKQYRNQRFASQIGTAAHGDIDTERKEDNLKRFTLDELHKCRGGPSNDLLVGIQGLVYNVGANEAGRMFYGPGGSYHIFAGRDATVALAKMALEEGMLNSLSLCDLPFAQPPAKWVLLSNEERNCIRQWARRCCSKYPLVGVIDFGQGENEAASKWREQIAKL